MQVKTLLAMLCMLCSTTSLATHIKGTGGYDFDYLSDGETYVGSFSYTIESPEFELAPDDEISALPDVWDIFRFTFVIAGLGVDIQEGGFCDCSWYDAGTAWGDIQVDPTPDVLSMYFPGGFVVINYYDSAAGFEIGSYSGSTEGGDWQNLNGGDQFEVPSPATLTLFGLGLAGLVWARRKQA